MSKPTPWRMLVGVLCSLAGTLLAQGAQASTLVGINHTHWAINRSVSMAVPVSTSLAPSRAAGEVAATSRHRAGSRV